MRPGWLQHCCQAYHTLHKLWLLQQSGSLLKDCEQDRVVLLLCYEAYASAQVRLLLSLELAVEKRLRERSMELAGM